jgi:hypothetical protein
MKYANSVALAGAMVWLVGCASPSRVVVVEPVGPAPAGTPHETSNGSLVVYSARTPAEVDVNTETWLWNNDFGKNEFLQEPAHTDYTIYTQDGAVLRHVRNARSMNADTPTLVTLPVGTYKVEARGLDCASNRVRVLMTVVIRPGETTMAHLEGDWNPLSQDGEAQLAKLPCGRVIGWRASEAGLAAFQAQ